MRCSTYREAPKARMDLMISRRCRFIDVNIGRGAAIGKYAPVRSRTVVAIVSSLAKAFTRKQYP